jgi:hypothetical protein
LEKDDSPYSFGERKWDLADLQKGYETLQSWRKMIVLTALETDDGTLLSYGKDIRLYNLGERKWDLADLQKRYETLQSWRMMLVLPALEKNLLA